MTQAREATLSVFLLVAAGEGLQYHPKDKHSFFTGDYNLYLHSMPLAPVKPSKKVTL